ncbi:MAG: type II/IV secretion system protein, partial [Phormidesmis sp. CAN_BIN36]|nr:type II/IV secretion system protein [Phormidesmis sp. CAN_BIN36]
MKAPNSSLSVWQQLKNRELTCEQALHLLVDLDGNVILELLDREVSNRFLREFPDRNSLPPLIPLLLWRNCFYLGSPVVFSEATIQKLSDRTFTDVKIIPVSDKSYRAWYHV